MIIVLWQIKLKTIKTIQIFFFVYFSRKNVSIKSVFKIHQILKLNYWKNYKSGRQMTMKEIVLFLTYIETQKIQ